MPQTIKANLLLSGLNEEQRRAVTAPEGPTVVFAGPGSGKTTVLTRRVLYLLERGGSAERMMIVTFTRAAAKEMKERLEQIMPDRTRRLFIGTFHSLFLHMLRETGERIPRLLKAGEQVEWVRKILAEHGQPTDDETVSTYLNQIGLCKGNAILPERLKVQKQKNILFRDLYRAYEEKKTAVGVWDYDDILLAVHRLCRNPEILAVWRERFQHILVDEFQDINQVQYDILVQLAREHQRLFVVGDDDQAIYGFRGSDPRFMLEMAKDFPSVNRIVLSVNYRSTDEIIQISERLIRQNRMRQAKPRIGTGRVGTRIHWWEPEDENDEAERILCTVQDGMETAVLFRTSTQARAVIDALVRKGIPFFCGAGEHSFYRRWQVQDFFAYLKLAWDPDDLDALARILNKPKRYLFGEEWLDACWHMARKMNRSLLDVLPELPGLEPYQKRYLDELRTKVPRLKGMSASSAVRYIREEIGYDRYLESFSKETGTDLSFVLESVEELVLAAEPFEDGQALMAHAKKVEQWIRASDELAKIKLMTLHRSKGLEFDRVCIIGLHAMVIPHHRSLQVPENRKNAAWEEERRLLYVGLTRARNELYLSVSKTRQGKRVGASPFLKEMGAPIHRKEIVSSVSPSARDGVRPFSLKRRYTQAQPQLRFASEQVTPGMKIVHNKFGEGLVLEVTPLDGVAPGRKILVRFGGELQILHYELSRQLGLITLP